MDDELVDCLKSWRDHFAPNGKRLRLADGNKERLHNILGQAIDRLSAPPVQVAAQHAPEGWSKVATLEEAASECSRIGTDTVFASDVTEDFKAGYQAAVNTCCASLALIARHAVPAAMLDAAPSVTITGDQA